MAEKNDCKVNKEAYGTDGKVSASLGWKLLELCGTQGIQLLVSIILARILDPEEFGTIALITVFLTIANTFVQSGFATALVQKKDIRQEDYSSVLWISMLLAAVMFAVLFLAAPWIADFYNAPVLREVLRVTAVILFPGAVVSIQSAYIARHLEFRKLFAASMIAVVVSGILAVTMALRGAGIWALSAQQILFYSVLMIALFPMIHWRPRLLLDFSRVKDLFAFGWKILAAGLMDTIWTNIYGLVIGKKFSSAELGGYNRGEQFPKLIAANLASAIQAVMLPTYSRLQDDREKLRSSLQATVQVSSFVIFPMMAGLIAVARPLVQVLLTDKWLFCVPYLRILSLCYALWPIHTANLQAINAQGRSDLFLKLEILKKMCGICFLLISLRYGILTILLFKLLNECICAFINVTPNQKLLSYGFLRQCRDMLPSFVCAAIMCGVTLAVEFTGLSGIVLLLVQILVGIVVYLGLSRLFNRKVLGSVISSASGLWSSRQDS